MSEVPPYKGDGALKCHHHPQIESNHQAQIESNHHAQTEPNREFDGHAFEGEVVLLLMELAWQSFIKSGHDLQPRNPRDQPVTN